MSSKIKFLSTSKSKAITIIILLSLALLVSGVFIWISNKVSNTVDPEYAPIDIEFGSFTANPYTEIETYDIFTFSVNDPSKAQGYIVLHFESQNSEPVGPTNFSVQVTYSTDIQYDTQLVTGYPAQWGSTALRYVYEQTGGGAIDFGVDLSGGDITVKIIYYVTFPLTVSLQISSTSS